MEMLEIVILFCAKIASCIGKAFLVYHVIMKVSPSSQTPTKMLQRMILGTLAASTFSDFCWLINLIQKYTFLSETLSHARVFLLRLQWAALTIEYLLLALFIERLSNKQFSYSIWHYSLMAFSACCTLYLTAIAYLNYSIIKTAERTFEYYIYGSIDIYFFATLIPSLIIALRNSKKIGIPRILQQQVSVVIFYFLVPHLIFLALSTNPYTIVTLRSIGVHQYLFITINEIFYLFALYFCVRKMLGLRFLNIHNHVQASTNYNFMHDFRVLLQQLGQVMSIEELEHISKSFFERAFRIPSDATHLIIRSDLNNSKHDQSLQKRIASSPLEQILRDETYHDVRDYLATIRILIRDEIEFDQFYMEDQKNALLLSLLQSLDVDIFLPIYERNKMVAYLIVMKDARKKELFSNIERDEMCVFGGYLGTIIYLLQHRNLSELIRQEKSWKDDLYIQHQKINHYQESIRTLLKTTARRTVGIITAQRRKLTWANDTMHSMLGARIPEEEHPIYSPIIKRLVQESIRYNTERSLILTTEKGRHLNLTAIPHNEGSHALVLAMYNDIADTFTIPFDALKDMSSWEYALYLETTRSGQLINQTIPGSNEVMLNFKIDLLKIALSKKIALLELPEDDLLPVVNILHAIGMRTSLHTIELSKIERNNEYGIQLFGVEPIIMTDTHDGLLTTLSETGTIFIKNIEYLSLETQQRLIHFSNTGMFKPIKSDRSLRSNIRIICSTTSNLELLVEQKKFSQELLQELRNSSITLPSLLTIPRHELAHIAQQVTEMTLQTKELHPLMSLNDKETNGIINRAPVSIHELQNHVRQALAAKSTKHKLSHLVKLDAPEPAFSPEVSRALRMGKHALKDKYLMQLLWNTFQSQSKIATLLNVNRSSISRRYKEFHINTEA